MKFRHYFAVPRTSPFAAITSERSAPYIGA